MNKTLILCLLTCIAWLSAANAAPGDVRVSVNKQGGKTEKGKAGGEGSQAEVSSLVTYDIKLENAILKELTDLNVEYIIFVERQKLATKKESDIIQCFADSQTVARLTKLAPQTLVTKEITLNKSNLVGNYIYPNGARVKVEDSVKGVWVRVSQAGNIIAEYTNPSTIKKQGWEKQ